MVLVSISVSYIGVGFQVLRAYGGFLGMKKGAS